MKIYALKLGGKKVEFIETQDLTAMADAAYADNIDMYSIQGFVFKLFNRAVI